jgi:uncharacterized protein DUF1016
LITQQQECNIGIDFPKDSRIRSNRTTQRAAVKESYRLRSSEPCRLKPTPVEDLSFRSCKPQAGMMIRRIVEYEQAGKKKAEYGEEVLIRLARDLRDRFGRGFSRQILQNMRQFYLTSNPAPCDPRQGVQRRTLIMASQRYSVTTRPIETLLSSNSYPIWSPYASFGAANVLLEALNTEQRQS